jgi:hypothetical protein
MARYSGDPNYWDKGHFRFSIVVFGVFVGAISGAYA